MYFNVKQIRHGAVQAFLDLSLGRQKGLSTCSLIPLHQKPKSACSKTFKCENKLF